MPKLKPLYSNWRVGLQLTHPPQINKLNEAIRQLRRQNRAQHEKLNKYRSAVHTLREQLEDLNLFNAKLLYVNKLLQNKNLLWLLLYGIYLDGCDLFEEKLLKKYLTILSSIE